MTHVNKKVSAMKKRIAQPVYLQIADDLRTRIQSEDWGPGSMLPSRADLAHEYGVALMTIQKAIQPLLEEGLLVASHRRGTFVSESAHAVLDTDSEVDARVADGAGVDRMPTAGAPTVGIIGSFHIDMGDLENWQHLDSWSSRTLRGFSQEIGELGGSAEVFNLHGQPESEDGPIMQCIQRAIESGVQCLVFADIRAGSNYDTRLPPLMEASGLPYVIVSGSSLSGTAPRVCIDERQAGRAAARHLLEAGYQRIVAMPLFDMPWERQRIEGAQKVAGDALVLPAQADIDLLRPAYGNFWNPIKPERAQLHAEILDRTIDFDALDPGEWAILMPNDPSAVPIHGVLQGLGIKPGRDIGLIGFDDHSYASLLGITSVGQPFTQIGVTAARLLCEAVRYGLDSVQAIVRCRVAARASTQRHPRGASKA